MLKKLIWNDVRRSRLPSGATVFFMAISAALLILTALLTAGLLGAIDSLMDKAVVPDVIQMHAGEVNEEALARFAESCEEVRKWQLCRFLNLDNSQLVLGGHNMVDSTQDNGLSVQSAQFDFLLGMDGELPEVMPGEVYVPVCYRAKYGLSVGDEMTAGETRFTIAGFLRDAQMNAMMASSKRFLVHPEDYEKLRMQGQEEYLIEFLLQEGTDVNAFQTAYADCDLPCNGPVITRALIRMINVLSDGMMIFVIFMVSIVVLLISMLCIHFILSIQMEHDRAVTAACTFLMLVLENLYNTLSDPSFVTYMGIGSGELRIDVRQTDEIDNVIDEIAAALEQDRQVEKYTVLQTGSCPAVLPDGSKVNLTVEAGDHLVFPVRYSAGTAPKEEGEIALSALDAKELDLHLGDTLRLAVGGVNTDYFVCGIYSDITNGGRTAKITGSRMQTPVIWSVLYISLSESADEKAWMEQYRLPGVEVVRIADYVEDTYAQTLSRLRLASGAVMGIGVLVIVVVLGLFSRLMVERNRDTISLRKALGFTSGACECDYFAGGMAPAAAGAAVGLLLGCQGGETLCGSPPDATGSCICWTAVSGEN